jgi:hypothetical protein
MIDLKECNQCGVWPVKTGYLCQKCKDDSDVFNIDANSRRVRVFSHNPLLGIPKEN